MSALKNLLKEVSAYDQKWFREIGGNLAISELVELEEAIKFYAKRYHDEHHMSDSFENCGSGVCSSAVALTKADQ